MTDTSTTANHPDDRGDDAMGMLDISFRPFLFPERRRCFLMPFG
jgi:hypothetical protein